MSGFFYAQAWALMHYFWHSGDGNGRRTQLNEFLNYILNGNPPKESFEKAFKTDYKTIEKELKDYVRQNRYNTLIFSSKSELEFETKMDIFPLEESEANAYQGDLLYHSNRFNDASVYLEEAIKLNPKSSLGNTSLGLVRMRQNKFSEAKKYLEKAVEYDPQNYLVHYNYAYVLSREGMNENGYVNSFDKDSDEKMRKSLRAAINLNPNFSESYNLFAFISIVQNADIDEALEMLKKARAIAPGNQWYLMRMSELYLRKEELDNARKIAQSIFDSAPDQQLRSYAENTLKNIDSFREQVSRMNSVGRPSGTIIIDSDKPLTKEEMEALQEKLMNDSVNEMLRNPKDGETRLTGFISKIECKQKGIIFTVKSGKELIQLTSETFQELELAAYNVDLEGQQFSCDSAFPNNLAVISYIPSKDSKLKIQGKIISIEIVPNNFKFVKIEKETLQ